MNVDHRRPLAAYVLVMLAGVLVIGQSLWNSSALDREFSIGANGDSVLTTPGESDGSLIDSTELAPSLVPTAPADDEGSAEEPEVEGPLGTFTPFVGSDFSGDGAIPFDPFGSAGSAAPAAPAPVSPEAPEGGQFLAAPETGLVGGDPAAEPGDSGDGDSGDGGGQGPSGTPGLVPDLIAGGGVFGGSPSADPTQPVPGTDEPGDDHGSDHGDGDGDDEGDEEKAAPQPHTFDNVPPHAHPYGALLGPRPGQQDGTNGQGDKGSSGDKGDKGGKGDKGKPESKPDPKPQGKPEPKPDPKPQGKPEPKTDPKPQPTGTKPEATSHGSAGHGQAKGKGHGSSQAKGQGKAKGKAKGKHGRPIAAPRRVKHGPR